MADSNALTANSEILDQLVLSAARGDAHALGALEARYGGVVYRVVRARVFSKRHRFITKGRAWECACLAMRRIAALQSSGMPFLAWLEIAAEEAFKLEPDAFEQPPRGGDGIADVDRCALELHVLGYGSTEIASVLGESQATVRQRIETTKQRLWARAMAENVESA